ncbi:rhodanese-related sulfurtransferase [Draconibacterium sp. IB214405]|uniref:oxygen-dependent tRNA uridine(34) hydroxylase TrhO n=1 Tax=Draconibacterium sp. IB214405 TaxID=3097352 RepID=UPI002A0D1EEF|nr:rhodanese-related sulfurtransferase [Draconibacterium sp. IB214405]MDX8339074.1 rhodanese-related sulfurtransferase [Draconibacterium sp. IB214405]
MFLYNRVNKEELKKRLDEETFQRKTISFYKYYILENPNEFRDELFRDWFPLECFGRIYVAREGINAQMSVPEHHWDAFVETLKKHEILQNIPIKYAIEDDGKSFYKLTIKVRPKLVADGLDDDVYDVTNVGKHLSGVEFHKYIGQEDTVVVDMRNYYESEIGHFEGAICPEADTFREELEIVTDLLEDKKDKKVLLYCTGGIRCEKASAYLKHQGFRDVNQLHGGILEYARQIKTAKLDSKFIGKNFVFDERLGESVNGEIISKCHQCGKACDSHTNCDNQGCHILFIQCPECAEKYHGCCTPECSDEKMQGIGRPSDLRIGFGNSRKFRKSLSLMRVEENKLNVQ